MLGGTRALLFVPLFLPPQSLSSFWRGKKSRRGFPLNSFCRSPCEGLLLHNVPLRCTTARRETEQRWEMVQPETEQRCPRPRRIVLCLLPVLFP